jgi:hypothetical protein
VFGVWGIDREGRMFLLCEIYHSHWTHQDWIDHILPICAEFNVQGMASDHDKALIEALNRALLRNNATPFVRIADKTLGLSGTKGKDARIEVFRLRLHRREIYFLEGSQRFVDTRLVDLKRPHSTVQEIPRMRYEEYTYGEDKVGAKIDERTPNHGVDMTLYGCSYAISRAIDRGPAAIVPAPQTARAIMGPKPWEVRRKRA